MQSIQIAEWFGMAAICLVSALTTVKILTGGSRQPRNAPLAGLLPPQPSVRSAVHPPNAPCDDDTDERADLSDIVVHAPYPIWKTDVNGRVIWGNMVYLDMVPAFRGADPDTDRPLFPVPADHASGRRSYRAGLHRAGATTPEWFDVTIVETGEISLFYAQDVNAVVSAEATQREFIQTLSKTFAQLSTGLAIFDREKTLLLFNPALIDLFALPVDFLSVRPSLTAFFDRLRDAQMMPEPKDYTSWRDHVADLAEAAAEGRYQETWTLPSGLVYHVTGRPHPGGAIAFLFEDISAEVSLTRQFRSELALYQSVVDTLRDAVCVLSANGSLVFANTAYHQVWGTAQDDLALRDISIDDLVDEWRGLAAPNGNWSALRDAVRSHNGDAIADFRFTRPDGGVAICTVDPLPGGSTLIAFRARSPKALPQRKLAEMV